MEFCSSILNISKTMGQERVYTYLLNSFCLHKSEFSVLIRYIQGEFHIRVTAKEDAIFNGNIILQPNIISV